MPDTLPLSQSDILPEDAYAAAAGRDPHVVAHFEDALAAHCKRRHAIACASGTAAVWAALAGLKLQAGDEVICSAWVPGSVLVALGALGARAVFVDVNPSQLAAEPSGVEAALSPRTRAILVAVGVAGQAGVEAVAAVARRLELPLIEDGGQAFGSATSGRALGTIGRASVFDFGHGAPLSTLCGGAVVTDDDRLADLARRILAAPDAAGLLPIGAPIAPFSASLGLAQLRRLPEILARRQELAECYFQLLLENPDLVLPDLQGEEVHAWPVFWTRLSTDYPATARDAILRHLNRHGIEADAGLRCAHKLPACHPQPQGKPASLPVAEALARRTLRLPLFNRMKEAQVEQVCHTLTTAMLAVRQKSADWPEGGDLSLEG